MSDDHGTIVELAANDCLALLRAADVGRLAVSRPTHPEVFPVNFVVDHGAVVFRTAAGTKLDALTHDDHVTFEADGYDAGSGDAWSVVIKGRAIEIGDVHDKVDAADLPLFPWHTAPKPRLVRILPVEMTGRRFHAARRDAAARAVAPHRDASE
jgi:hypothetical protein